MQLDYFFDPFCGWCYAGAPALSGLAGRFGASLCLQPTGLFTTPRPVAAIADHAFRNDTRIGELTGQVFTEAYHRGVMRAPGGVFDSTAAMRALIALGGGDTAKEAGLLHRLQSARYVDGRDTSKPAEVAAVLAPDDAGAFAARLTGDAAVIAATEARIGAAQRKMQRLDASGVPLLAVSFGKEITLVQGQDLYAGADHLTALLDELSHANDLK